MLSCYYEVCMGIDRVNNQGINPLISLWETEVPSLAIRVKTPMAIELEAQYLTPSERVVVLSERLAAIHLKFGTSTFAPIVDVTPNLHGQKGRYMLGIVLKGRDSREFVQYSQRLEDYQDFITNLFEKLIVDVRGKKYFDELALIRQEAKERALLVVKMQRDINTINFASEQKSDLQLLSLTVGVSSIYVV